MPMLPLQSRGGQLPLHDYDSHERDESVLTTQAPDPTLIPMVDAGRPQGLDPMFHSGPCHMMQTEPEGTQETHPPSIAASPFVHQEYPEVLQEQLVQPSPINFSGLQPASDHDYDSGFYSAVQTTQHEFDQEPGESIPGFGDRNRVPETSEKLGQIASYLLERNPVHLAKSPEAMAKVLGSNSLSDAQMQAEMVRPICSAELMEFHRQDRLTSQLDAHKAASDRIFRENQELQLEVEELNARLLEQKGFGSPGSELDAKLRRLEELEQYVLALQKSKDSLESQLKYLQDQTGQQGLVEKLDFAMQAENVISENTALKGKNLELEARLTQQKADYDADAFVLQATVRQLEGSSPHDDSGLAAENATLQAIITDLQTKLALSADSTVENNMLKQNLAGLEGRLALMLDNADAASSENRQLRNKAAELEAELERLRIQAALDAGSPLPPHLLETQPVTFASSRGQDREPSQAPVSSAPQAWQDMLKSLPEDPTLQARVTELASRPLYEQESGGTVSFSDGWGLLNSYDDRPGDDEATGSGRDTFHFYDQRDQHGIPSLPVVTS